GDGPRVGQGGGVRVDDGGDDGEAEGHLPEDGGSAGGAGGGVGGGAAEEVAAEACDGADDDGEEQHVGVFVEGDGGEDGRYGDEEAGGGDGGGGGDHGDDDGAGGGFDKQDREGEQHAGQGEVEAGAEGCAGGGGDEDAGGVQVEAQPVGDAFADEAAGQSWGVLGTDGRTGGDGDDLQEGGCGGFGQRHLVTAQGTDHGHRLAPPAVHDEPRPRHDEPEHHERHREARRGDIRGRVGVVEVVGSIDKAFHADGRPVQRRDEQAGEHAAERGDHREPVERDLGHGQTVGHGGSSLVEAAPSLSTPDPLPSSPTSAPGVA